MTHAGDHAKPLAREPRGLCFAGAAGPSSGSRSVCGLVVDDRLDDAVRRIQSPTKIETKTAFENPPRILLETMRRPPLAVMIARDDLAVELGFERPAEVQEEILWLCEASHVPLDTLARTGVPSLAEVTDAAVSLEYLRAACPRTFEGWQATSVAAFALLLIACVGLAEVTYRLSERPFLVRKARFDR